ncbi:uncharacterized protein V1516DRAFT_673847 [Lipomyces oligophaga]|uniref:uncharacterized protein n=1 Tax=Lipomyces oligophaga TaxID=45792 RepID=UPI0034CEB542
MPRPRNYGGVLPRVRPVIKFPAALKKTGHGYAPGVEPPRGVSAQQIAKPMPNEAQVLQKTLGKRATQSSNRYMMTDRERMAELRKLYLSQAIRRAFKDHREAISRRANTKETQLARNEALKAEQVKSEQERVFSLPTISSFVQTYHAPRVLSKKEAEAKKLIKLSNQFEMLANKYKAQETQIGKLWNESSSFITDMESFDRKLSLEFMNGKQFTPAEYLTRSLERLIVDRYAELEKNNK